MVRHTNSVSMFNYPDNQSVIAKKHLVDTIQLSQSPENKKPDRFRPGFILDLKSEFKS